MLFHKSHNNEHRDCIRATPLTRFTPHTIIDPDLYLKALEAVRETRVAFDDEEYISGVRAVAAAIKPQGAHTPTIWVVGFTAGMDDQKIPSILEQTRAAAQKINKKLAGAA